MKPIKHVKISECFAKMSSCNDQELELELYALNNFTRSGLKFHTKLSCGRIEKCTGHFHHINRWQRQQVVFDDDVALHLCLQPRWTQSLVTRWYEECINVAQITSTVGTTTVVAETEPGYRFDQKRYFPFQFFISALGNSIVYWECNRISLIYKSNIAICVNVSHCIDDC